MMPTLREMLVASRMSSSQVGSGTIIRPTTAMTIKASAASALPSSVSRLGRAVRRVPAGMGSRGGRVHGEMSEVDGVSHLDAGAI